MLKASDHATFPASAIFMPEMFEQVEYTRIILVIPINCIYHRAIPSLIKKILNNLVPSPEVSIHKLYLLLSDHGLTCQH
jgi:hypothetical protein